MTQVQAPRWLIITALAFVATVALVGLGSQPVAAGNTTLNDTAPYYENESSSVNDSAWFAGHSNVSLDSIVGMASRLGPYVIGTGSTIPGGNAYAGPLILGLVMTGVFLGAVAGMQVGAPGGAVVALLSAYGLGRVGLAPVWLRIVILALLGAVSAVVVIRATR